MQDSKRAATLLTALGLFIALGLSLLVAFAFWRSNQPFGEDDPVASSERPRSSWKNTEPEATYIGNAACAECHEAEHESYLTTAHSNSLSLVKPDQEPPDGEFFHADSNRHYAIYRKDGEMRHRESFVDEEGAVLAETDHPVRWLFGSGRHSRSYLVEVDGFLVESPITWYSKDEQWDMSPGYVGPDHFGFERPVDRGCLYCHIGEHTPRRTGYQTVKIVDAAISCERCHGPGSLHAQFHESGPKVKDVDYTIVNPAHLDRELHEDICAQCHLRGEATVMVAGQDLTDFRPGLPLSQFRIDFRARNPNAQMKVVGHVEQMRLSRCYQRSPALTCTTCHDPHHDSDEPTDYQSACLQCHGSQDCREDEAKRQQEAKNRCVTCHMPQSDTDIPHIAFTHHRIGVHSNQPPEAAPEKQDQPTELTPWGRLDHLTQYQRDRAQGLAYLEYSTLHAEEENVQLYRTMAKVALEELLDKRIPDYDIDAALALLAFQSEPQAAEHAAAHALDHPGVSDTTRVNMLFLLGELFYRQHQHDFALQVLTELTTLRRHSEDYLLIGLCHAENKDYDKAIASYEQAIRINPFRSDLHIAFAESYEGKGDAEAAKRHRAQAAKLDWKAQAPEAERDAAQPPTR